MTPLGSITPNNSPDLRRTFKIDIKQKLYTKIFNKPSWENILLNK